VTSFLEASAEPSGGAGGGGLPDPQEHFLGGGLHGRGGDTHPRLGGRAQRGERGIDALVPELDAVDQLLVTSPDDLFAFIEDLSELTPRHLAFERVEERADGSAQRSEDRTQSGDALPDPCRDLR
jgi:hypothetical protein